MTSTFNKILITFAIFIAAFAFVNFSQTLEVSLVNTVEAAGSCGSCGGGNTGGGGNTPGDAPDNDPEVSAPTCNVSASVEQVNAGDEYVISWHGTPSNASFALGGTPVGANGTYTFVWDADNVFLTFTFTGHNAAGSCSDTVTVYRKVDAPTCDISANITAVEAGGQFTVSWHGTPNHSTLFKVNGTTVAADDSATYTFPANRVRPITFTLTGSNASGQCSDEVTIERNDLPVLSCDAFDITQTQVTPGATLDLSWETSNADSVSIDHGVGTVAADGSKSIVAPTTDGTYTYTLTATKGSESVTCDDSVIVHTPTQTAPAIDIIKRDASDKDDTQTVSTGGTAYFEIVVTNTGTEDLVNVVVNDPREASCNKTIGSLAVGASHTYTCDTTNVQADFTNIANVTGNSVVDNQEVTDTDPTNVHVAIVEVFTCENNVQFTANPDSLPRGGGNVTLTWNVTGADSVSISGLSSTAHSGSESVQVTTDTTFILTAIKSGYNTINCPVTVNVQTGGGHHHHSTSPKCKLTVSDDKISAGEEITLTWDTTRAREVILKDNHGHTLLETEDSDKFDGEKKVKPTKDTVYTLITKRGVKKRTCEVEVDVISDVTVLETRTQDPRVAGISLTQVPYTGFEAGPALTMIFYFILTIWGLFVAYIFVIRRDSIGGVSLAGANDNTSYTDVSVEENPVTHQSEAETYMDTVVASQNVPADLPVANDPVIGYAATMTEEEAEESLEMTELENRAHAQKVLLSSDAMRFFMNATKPEERIEKLDAVIAQAKASFPSEDGWVVLNLARIESLSTNDVAEAQTNTQDTPITAGSLAEAIVEGNIVAAYQMIEHRPMVALADAAADLDAVYRARKGEKVSVSDMLLKNTEGLTNAQLEEAIAALTGAVDGTYSDEAEAVKMAILKAVKAVA